MCYSDEVGIGPEIYYPKLPKWPGGCIVEYPPKPRVPTDLEQDEEWEASEDIWEGEADDSSATDDDWDSETAEEQENLPEDY